MLISQMRALHLVKTSVGATWALRLVRELAALGIDVHVALPEGGLSSQYERAGAKVHAFQPDIAVRTPWRIPGQLRAFRELVHRVAPDVIHSHFVGTTLSMRLALGRESGIPRFFQVPGPLHLEHPVFRALELGSADNLDHWIGSCEWTCDRYRSLGVPTAKIFRAYYGLDSIGWQKPSTGTLRRELGMGPDTPIVGMVAYYYAPKRYLGHTRGLKGHEDLIDAMVTVRTRRPEARVVFVGGPWGRAQSYAERVQQYAQTRLGNAAVFLGTRHDVPALYADLNVVVHPSLSENVGGAMESQLLAVPTIATDIGGFPDAVRDGETGWLVPPRSPARLAQAIESALADPRRAKVMALEGQRQARERFDLRKNAEAVVHAYQSALANDA